MKSERLIVFVKAPRPGTVKTRLAESLGMGRACSAYQQLVEVLLANLRDLPSVELRFSPDDAAADIHPWLSEGWSCSPQGPGDLGQRLQAAFADAFATGATRVVIVGSDCPSVRAYDIQAAWSALGERDVVIGPARDGGYWLIGLRQARPAIFRGIPWSTDQVFSETLERTRQAGLSLHLLRELEDVDSEEQWRRFLSARNRDGIKTADG